MVIIPTVLMSSSSAVTIDFIAGHDLLRQGAEAVFAILKERAECKWRVGRPISYTGGEAAVLIDHVHHHSDFLRWPRRFYMLHDLGDLDVYGKERQVLRQCTAVIVPDEIHAAEAQRRLVGRWYRRGTTIFIGGWAKYDGSTVAQVNKLLAQTLEHLPDRPTVLYAPSWAGTDEWRTLLPLLNKLPVNLIIKNHPYATAPGEEVSNFYRRSRRAVAAMEEAARKFYPPATIAPADSNVCQLFPYMDVAISDQSSVLAEFLPWGVSYETGANPEGTPQPSISRWYPEVKYRPLERLAEDLRKGGRQFLGEAAESGNKAGPQYGAAKRIAEFIWQTVCR